MLVDTADGVLSSRERPEESVEEARIVVG